MKEGSPKTDPIQEAKSFLKTNYPVRRADVNEVLEQLGTESKRGSVYEAIQRNIEITIDFAKDGLGPRVKGASPDILYVPARLFGILEFENKNRVGLSQQLPLSRYLGILAIGELASLTKNVHRGWRFDQDEGAAHLSRFKELIKFQQKLLKTNNRL